MILQKLQENKEKQASKNVEKTYIVDDFTENLVPSNESSPEQNEYSKKDTFDSKHYLKDRRVTTVEEQQTWEDLEDDYGEEAASILKN